MLHSKSGGLNGKLNSHLLLIFFCIIFVIMLRNVGEITLIYFSLPWKKDLKRLTVHLSKMNSHI